MEQSSNLKRVGNKWHGAEDLKTRLQRCKSVDSNGCWNSIRKMSDRGYGRIKVNGEIKTLHRVSYSVFVGDIPDGFLVCHKCDNRKCFNPDHLFLGSPKDNTQDMLKKGRKVYKHSQCLKDMVRFAVVHMGVNVNVVIDDVRHVSPASIRKWCEP